MENEKKNVWRKIIDVVLWVFLGFAILITVITFSANASGKGYPVFGDKIYISVLSDSMKSDRGFKKGDLIVVKVATQEDKDNLEPEDVISFWVDLDGDGEKELNTHRIKYIEESGSYETYKKIYHTYGDNSSDDDYSIGDGEIVGIWTGKKVAVVGGVMNFLRGKVGFLIFIVIPMCGFFLYELISVIQQINAMKNEGKRIITEEDEEEIKRRAIEEYLAQQKAEEKKE